MSISRSAQEARNRWRQAAQVRQALWLPTVTQGRCPPRWAEALTAVSYAVSRRTREFGFRMALGATPGNVLGLVVRSTGRVLAVGFVLGAIVSVGSDRALAGKLEGIGVANPSMLAAITSILAVATFLACAVPARSATKVQPVDALRHEYCRNETDRAGASVLCNGGVQVAFGQMGTAHLAL